MMTSYLRWHYRRHRTLNACFQACAYSCLLLFAMSCDVPTASRPVPGYNPTSLTNGLYFRWKSGSTVSVWVETTNLPPTTDLKGAASRTIPLWNTVPQYGEVRLVAVTNPAEANIIIYDAASPLPVQPSASCPYSPSGAGGYTYFCPTGNSSLSDVATVLPRVSGGGHATVVIRVDRGRATSQIAYDALVAHELGHALGIGAHSDNNTDLMFGTPLVAQPSARDIATLRFVLGQPPNIRL